MPKNFPYLNSWVQNVGKFALISQLFKNVLLDSKKDTDVKNRLLDSVGEGEGGMIWENALKHVYYHVRN